MNSNQARKRFAAPRTVLLAASLCGALSLSAVLAPDNAFAASAKAASVTTTYANFSASIGTDGFVLNPQFTAGYQFTPKVSGSLQSFTVAIGSTSGNPSVPGGPYSTVAPFTVSLYADSKGSPGTLLGTYSGSTQQWYGYKPLIVVPAGGGTLTAGKPYWMVISSSAGGVHWNYVDDAGSVTQPLYSVIYGYPYVETYQSCAFSVQIKP